MMPVIFKSVVALIALTIVSSFSHFAQAEDEYTVAFVGDLGIYERSRHVMELVRDEGTDLLLLQGDLAYGRGTANTWIQQMEDTFADDFPIALVAGNHEKREWPVFKAWYAERLKHTPELRCEGDPGVKSYCQFRDMGIVQVSPGMDVVPGIDGDDDYAGFIKDQFTSDSSVWRVCSWHYLQKDMQIGGKSDEAGWEVYQACLRYGGIVATGHEHSYSRTFLMNDFEGLDVVHRNDHLEVGPGQSFAFVSGLGGQQIRPQLHDGDWWAAKYSSTQNAEFGALFCRYNGARASCYFKDLAGQVIDSFTLASLLSAQPTPSPIPSADIDSDAPQPDTENPTEPVATPGPSTPAEPPPAAPASEQPALDSSTGGASGGAMAWPFFLLFTLYSVFLIRRRIG